jgi:hypothetical protein
MPPSRCTALAADTPPTAAFGQELRHIAAVKDRTCECLLRVSMIASLRAATELG